MEKNSFEDVYVSYEKPVYNYVLRMVKDGSLAEDITQDVFVKVYQNLANFRGDAKLSTWIYQIATNTYLDYFRSAAHKKESMTDHLDDDGMDDSIHGEAEKVLTIDEQLVKSEMSACVHEFVNKLPEDYRAVIVLHDLQGLKNREIADILGCSLDTVKIRLHRARKKFRTTCAADCNLYRDADDTLCCEKKENEINEL
jgi:RNA polymerase sigma-70 factor (ECF subfamily)